MAPDGRTRKPLRRPHSTVRRIPCPLAALCARCGRQWARPRCWPDPCGTVGLTLLPCCSRPGMHPYDGRVVSNFIMQAPPGGRRSLWYGGGWGGVGTDESRVPGAGHQRGGHHRVRRGEADALLLLCRRPRRRADEADEPDQHHRPGQHRQPGRVHDQAGGSCPAPARLSPPPPHASPLLPAPPLSPAASVPVPALSPPHRRLPPPCSWPSSRSSTPAPARRSCTSRSPETTRSSESPTLPRQATS